MADDAFWIDTGYDRDHASDGVSRYSAYVRDGRFDPWTDDDQAVELAVFAWRRATGPVMVPGYVRRHRRILSAQLARSEWDGSLAASVELITPWPGELRSSQAWRRAALWRDWPAETLIGAEAYYEPSGEDLARGPYLLASTSLQFTVASGELPHPPTARLATLPGELEDAAEHAVTVLVAELNRIVGPVIETLERG
jgi:hypothetical protein